MVVYYILQLLAWLLHGLVLVFTWLVTSLPMLPAQAMTWLENLIFEYGGLLSYALSLDYIIPVKFIFAGFAIVVAFEVVLLSIRLLMVGWFIINWLKNFILIRLV